MPMDAELDNIVVAFVELVAALGPTDRQSIMDRLRVAMCLHCGAPDPRCQCWNDK